MSVHIRFIDNVHSVILIRVLSVCAVMKPSKPVVLLFLLVVGYWMVPVALSGPTVCAGVTGEEGGYLNGLNVARFEGCQIVNGNLVINGSSFASNGSTAIAPASLSALSNITVITGYLHLHDISHPLLAGLKYLSKLRHIGGNDTVVFFMIQHFALVITKVQYLETLNLASLTTIGRGGVKIDDNPRLCLVNTITYNTLIVDPSPLVRTNGNNISCRVSCHSECNSTMGCWGLEDDECISCRNYRHGNTCIQQCDQNVTFSDSSTCHSCHHHCHNQHGCTGPAHHLGEGGCNQCADTIHVTDNNTLVCGAVTTTIVQLLLTTSSTPEFKSTHTSSHATPSPSHFPPVTPSQGTLPPSPSPVSTQFPLLTAIVPAVVVAMVTILTIALILIVAQLHKRSKKKGSLRVTRRYSDTHQVMVTAWKDTSNGGYSSKQQQSVSLAGLASRHHATPHSPCAPPLAPPPCQYSSRRTSLSNSLSTSSSRGTHSHRSSTSNSSNSTRTHYPPPSSRPRLTPDPT